MRCFCHAKRYTNAPRPDLIILDLNLPGLGGRELLIQIKGDPDFKAIPTIILTSSDMKRISNIATNTTRIFILRSRRNGMHLAQS
jgi:CheY-like chemotaxis protein